MSVAARAVPILLVVLAAACGETASSPNLPGPDAAVDDGCAAMLPTCLENQQICVAGPKCESCPRGQHAAATGRCVPLAGSTRAHEFPENTVRAGSEVL